MMGQITTKIQGLTFPSRVTMIERSKSLPPAPLPHQVRMSVCLISALIHLSFHLSWQQKVLYLGTDCCPFQLDKPQDKFRECPGLNWCQNISIIFTHTHRESEYVFHLVQGKLDNDMTISASGDLRPPVPRPPLSRASSSAPCCVITHKPVEKILIWWVLRVMV